MNGLVENLQSLVKALEAGGYNAAPSTLVQGSALQVEDLSPVMQNVTYGEEHLKLQKVLKVETCKSTLAQFDRQLSYGIFGGSAQLEGAVGQEEESSFVRIVVPMCYYSHTRRVTVVANMVATVDGVKAEERAASDAAKKLAGDVEFDIFRGKADFSNAGVFDGNPLAIPVLPNMLGLDVQIRVSDAITNTQDLMFAEYGSDISVVIAAGDILTQANIEDSHVRSAMNLGSADRLFIDPLALSAYNKTTYGATPASATMQRIMLAGSPQDASGADLRRQWTSGGVVQIEASRFLSGKTGPARARASSPVAPTLSTQPTDGGVDVGSALTAGDYIYWVTAVNENGESAPTVGVTVTVTAGHAVTLAVNGSLVPGTKYWNVYRSAADGTKVRFIGRFTNTGAASVVFTDLGNKIPGFVTGFLLQTDTAGIKELAPYSRLKLAVSDLSIPEAHFRFLTLAVFQPRKNVLIDNIKELAPYSRLKLAVSDLSIPEAHFRFLTLAVFQPRKNVLIDNIKGSLAL